MHSLTNPTLNRIKLGYFETKSALAYSVSSVTSPNQYCCDDQLVTVTALQGQIKFTHLIKTIEMMFNKLQRLRCSLHIDAQHEFYLLENVKFSDVPAEQITHQPEPYWKELVKNKLNTPLPVDKYLFDICLFSPTEKTHYFIVRFHHVITDGISSAELIHNILLGYFEPDLIMNKQTIIHFQPPEYFYRHKISIEEYQRIIASDISAKAIPYETMVPLEEREAKSLLLSFQLDPIKNLCRKLNCRVNSLITTILLQTYLETHHTGSPAIALGTCVDLRHRIQGINFSAEYFGSFFNNVMNYFSIKEFQSVNDFNEKVNYVQKAIDEKIKSCAQPPIQTTKTEVDQICEISKQATAKNFQYQIDMSNLGKLSIKNNYGNGSLHVAAYFFFVNAKLAFPEFLYNFATIEDSVFSHITYVKPCHSEQTAIKFAQHFIENLKKYIPNFLFNKQWTDVRLLLNNKHSPATLLSNLSSPLNPTSRSEIPEGKKEETNPIKFTF